MTDKPATGTNEWSTTTVNCMDGCSNDCLYCYAKSNAVRFGRMGPEDWKEEKPRLSVLGKRFGKRRGTVMFPSSHDITPGNWTECSTTLVSLVKAGNKVLVVSKPAPEVIENLTDDLLKEVGMVAMERVLFRFTIGAGRTDTLKLWEPHAPSYEERLYSLMFAFKHGWQTSVSMEPLLEDNLFRTVEHVRALAPFVTDSIWIGKMNSPRARICMNTGIPELPAWLELKLRQLLDSQKDEQIMLLYEALQAHPMVRWKESIKKVVGLELATEKGLDR